MALPSECSINIWDSWCIQHVWHAFIFEKSLIFTHFGLFESFPAFFDFKIAFEVFQMKYSCWNKEYLMCSYPSSEEMLILLAQFAVLKSRNHKYRKNRVFADILGFLGLVSLLKYLFTYFYVVYNPTNHYLVIRLLPRFFSIFDQFFFDNWNSPSKTISDNFA